MKPDLFNGRPVPPLRNLVADFAGVNPQVTALRAIRDDFGAVLDEHPSLLAALAHVEAHGALPELLRGIGGPS